MKILVCISSVPDTTSKINFTADYTAFDKTGIQWVINPLDEFTLTKAIQLKQKHSGSVTVITVGDATAEAVIRKALAIGADEAIRIDMDPKDSFSVAKEIATVAQADSYDLILCGKESIDYNGGVVPGILAELLGYSFVNACVGLEISDSEATVTREIEGGKESVVVQLPIVVAAQKGLVDEKDLIIPNMRGIMSARTKPLKVQPPIATNPKVETISFESAPSRAAVKLFSPDDLDGLIKALHEEAKVI